MKFESKINLLIVISCISIFILDLATPLGVAGGVPYIAVILMGSRLSNPLAPLKLAALTCILTAVGFFLSPEYVSLDIVLTNRFYAIFAICVTAILLYKRRVGNIRFINAFEGTTVGNIITDEFGIIKAANSAVLKMFGYTKEELLNKNINILMPTKERDDHDKYLSDYSKTGKKNIIGIGRELIGRHKDGKNIPIHLGLSEMNVGHKTNFLGAITDLSKLKEAQIKAEESNIAKSQFIATMSHELRTPLNAVIGFSDLIKQSGINELEPEKTEEYLELINSSGKELLLIVNDILDVTQTQLGQIIPSHNLFDLEDVIKESLEISDNLIKLNENNIVLKLDQELNKVMLDRKLVFQIVNKLINNAAKFTKNGTITIETSIIKQNSSHLLQVSVNDTGIGVKQADLEGIFDRFTQVEQAYSRSSGGTGIGLAIAKEFSTLLGGNIKVESQVGTGSTFKLLLPLENFEK